MTNALTESEAVEYAPQWGSYISAGDPGGIMYSRVPPEEAGHRDAMVAYIRDHCLPLALEGDDAESDDEDSEYTDAEMLNRLIAYLEALHYERPPAVNDADPPRI